MIPFAKPMIGTLEMTLIRRVLRSGRLTEGAMVERFEQDFEAAFGGYAVAVSSCTAGLAMAARLIDLGDQPIKLTAMTHVATAHALHSAGHNIEFVDCNESGRATTDKVGVSYLGAPASGVLVDQATHLAKPCGERASVYSFYPSKHITTCEGGMISTPDAGLADQFRRMRAFGKIELDGRFDVVAHGLNWRMSEVHAAIGIEQLKKAPRWLNDRAANWKVLKHTLPHELRVLDTSKGSYYALAAYVPDGVDRDAYRARMLARGVETSVYYPTPVPYLSYYRERARGEFPNALRIATRTVCFPVGQHLDPFQIEKIARVAKESL